MKKYIFIVVFLFYGCLDYQKPFQDDKSSLLISEHKIFGIYVSEIIGLNDSDNTQLRKLIASELRNKDLLASHKIINKNSFILKGTAVRYNTSKKIFLLWQLKKLNSKNIFKFKTEINISNNNLKLELEKISNDISSKIYKHLNRSYKKLILIRNVNIFQNQKIKEDIFISTLKNKIKSKKLNLEIKKFQDNVPNYENARLLDIKIKKFLIKDKEKIDVKWTISNTKEKELGSIIQSRTLKKGLIDKLWIQITEKIIEMAISELNYLTWVD